MLMYVGFVAVAYGYVEGLYLIGAVISGPSGVFQGSVLLLEVVDDGQCFGTLLSSGSGTASIK